MFPSLLISVLIALFIVGVLIWGVMRFPWIDSDFKQAARVIIVVIFAVWLIATLAGVVPQPHYFR